VRSLVVVLALVLGLLVPAGCEDAAPPTSRSEPPALGILNLNTATEKQLEKLPAIGEKHARSIIASRNARGGRFRSLDDLLAIDGIGPKTIDAIRPYVVVE